MKTAIVHDWLSSEGGAEKVLEKLIEIFPAPVFTLFHDVEKIKLKCTEIHSSFIQHLPFVKKHYRNYLPFYPFAIERFDLSSYDLIISSSHAVAKGVKTRPGQLHICYCHTPMRYAWDLEQQYLESLDPIRGALARQFLKYLRKWDFNTQTRVDHFVANSHFISERIRRIYGRDSTVIYPPVETNYFELCSQKDDYYLTVSRLVPYKKVDLIISAFSQMPHKKLKIVGEGPDLEKLKSSAKSNVEFLGFRNDLNELYKKAKGFVFAAEEDFGIAPVEAEACGTPVIAYKKGGVLETVLDGQTGLLFEEQTAECLLKTIQKFEKIEWDANLIRTHAEKFGANRFKTEFNNFINQKWEQFCENRYTCRR